MNPFDFTNYIDMAMRRKWWFIIPFLLVLLVGLAYFLAAPKVYMAETFILVQPQKVPEDYVRSIISTTVEDRLATIIQQVTSRTNLEKIIRDHGLYASLTNPLMEDKVALLRANVAIEISNPEEKDVEETNAFTIRYHGEHPRKVMEVTNALASSFISENLRIREAQALGTSVFISDELASIKEKLIDKEEELKQYQEKFMGGLPQQLGTNLSILERLQAQVDQLSSNLRDAGNRKILIQAQITEQEKEVNNANGVPLLEEKDEKDITLLRRQLANLEARYTKSHPDVIRLKQMISKMESEQSESRTEDTTTVRTLPPSELVQTLKRQLQDLDLEIKSLKAEIAKSKSQIKYYDKKVEETPKREQELLSLKRDYENLQELYNSLLNRKLESEIAVSMERKQKGEQFRIIDPALTPIRPVEPDVRKIILLSIVLGLSLGSGLAFLKESLDTSYKTPEEIETENQIPVLVSMPIRYTENEIKRMKMKTVLTYSSVSLGFVLSAIGIIFSIKGVGNTIYFVKQVLGGM